MNEEFQRTLDALTDRQREAVEHIDGPLLVLAGPGTGKTQLLSARVANILVRTDVDPSNIVCLTFTVNAANNMRERLRKMIGQDANQVIIKTFHSLAAEIIASHPEHFYAGAVLNPVSDLAAQQIIQSILDTLPHDNPLAVRFEGKYSQLSYVLSAIGKAKDAALSPVKLRSALETHHKDLEAIEGQVVELLSKNLSHKTLPDLAAQFDQLAAANGSDLALGISKLISDAVETDLPTGKTSNTSKLKSKLLGTENGQKVMLRERKANSWWQSLAEVYEVYQARLYKQGYMDYSDMLISVIEALENSQDLRLDIQESVHYLLVDEFQDSNEAQIKLLHLLVDNPAIEKPNVMVVGDPNQTIYGFNGAMLDNTTDFAKDYQEHLRTVTLEENFRSSQKILDDSLAVISPYSNFRPDLTAKNEPESTEVAYTAYATEADQAVLVTEDIKQRLERDSASSVAVLARDHSSLVYLSKYLMHAGLTVNYEQSIDIRNTACNRLIINTLSLIQAITAGNKQASDYLLSELLRHSCFYLPAEDIWSLALSTKNSSWLDQASKHPATSSIVAWLNNLVSLAASQPLNVLIEQMLSSEFAAGNSLYQAFYQNSEPESAIIEAQATKRLLEIARQYAETDKFNLNGFLLLLDETSDKLFLFSPTTGHYANAVTLMSVHGAKGLEFDHVYIINSDESSWRAKAARYPTPLSLPIHTNAETASDYARLMYVAMTRAKQTLHVSYVTRADSKTSALPAEQLTQFEFVPAESAPIDSIAQSEIAQIASNNRRPKNMHELLSEKLANYSLTATHLTNFLDLSREGMDTFIEECLVGFPGPASEALSYGDAMHAAMELAQIQATNNKPDLDAIKRRLSQKLTEYNLTSTVVERLTNRGLKQLDVLFNKIGLQFDPASQPEQRYTANISSGLSLYGKIDRIDITGDNTICIVDYKTGKPITNPNSSAQAVLLKQWRHRLQLGLYILMAKYQKANVGKRIIGQIIQLDASEPEHLYLSYEFTDQDLERIERLALAVFRRIKTLDIPDVSKYSPDLKGIQTFEEDLLSESR